MHILIAILGLAAGAFWYFRVFSQGASEVADAANTLANIPRRRRFAKAARTEGYALLDTPTEAATALLVSLAKLGRARAVTDAEKARILHTLTRFMQQEPDEADDLLTQVESLLYTRIQHMDAVAPCVRILHPALERGLAEGLADEMEALAAADGGATTDQSRFIANYRERMGLP